ncbi:hypothetical protein ACETRX_03835 [Labrys portucalensis]|uniref:Uncharacterized protein n=1 Tax=Labrys neptuniae TaxID=376174 RepID=A0ABV6Z9A3_9HYPH
MAELTLVSFAALLTQVVESLPAARHEALEQAAVVVEKESKRVIGTYEYGWRQLRESTQDGRASAGFPPNEPLLVTGELRESIEHNSDTNDAHIGSNNEKAIWQELGTTGIPPRSFLAMAAARKEKEVVDILGGAGYQLLIGGSPRFIGPTKP